MFYFIRKSLNAILEVCDGIQVCSGIGFERSTCTFPCFFLFSLHCLSAFLNCTGWSCDHQGLLTRVCCHCLSMRKYLEIISDHTVHREILVVLNVIEREGVAVPLSTFSLWYVLGTQLVICRSYQ